MQQYLHSTMYFDFESSLVKDFSAKHVKQGMSDKEMAVALYYGVRDDVKYNPYVFNTDPATLTASYCLETKESYCVPKAILLGALARLNGIPSRLGLADVKNHLSSPALIEWLRSDLFVMHGYIELFIKGKWVKATPAFNKALCRIMKVDPLEFNGEDDSIFHEFNGQGHKHMEYVNDHGVFDDLPIAFVFEKVAEAYPHLVKDFDGDRAKRKLEDEI